VLKHLKFALNVAFFVRHEYFLHPKSGNLQEVSQESLHIYTLEKWQPYCPTHRPEVGLCRANYLCAK
jgi:hypothetical protein